MLTCNNISACGRLFPIIDLRYVFSFLKRKVNLFIKIHLRGQSSNHNFKILEIWTRKTDILVFWYERPGIRPLFTDSYQRLINFSGLL